MAQKVWQFDIDGKSHKVELEHGYWSGNRLIRIDGNVVEKSRKIYDPGTTHVFDIENHECIIRILYQWRRPLTFSYECTLGGKLISGSGIEK